MGLGRPVNRPFGIWFRDKLQHWMDQGTNKVSHFFAVKFTVWNWTLWPGSFKNHTTIQCSLCKYSLSMLKMTQEKLSWKLGRTTERIRACSTSLEGNKDRRLTVLMLTCAYIQHRLPPGWDRYHLIPNTCEVIWTSQKHSWQKCPYLFVC